MYSNFLNKPLFWGVLATIPSSACSLLSPFHLPREDTVLVDPQLIILTRLLSHHCITIGRCQFIYRSQRMLGTFNQCMPMILSNKWGCHSYTKSLVGSDIGAVHWFCAVMHEMCPISWHRIYIELYGNIIFPDWVSIVHYDTTQEHNHYFHNNIYYTK